MKPKGKVGRFRHYDENTLREAVQAVRNGGKLREICRQYGVPKSTVQDRIKGKVADVCKTMGPDPVLSIQHEKKIVKWVEDLAKCGFPINKQELFDSVQKIVQAESLKTPFKNGRPGHKWYMSFMRRNPQLSLKKAEALEKYRAQITEGYIRSWFSDLESFLMGLNATDVLDDPSRILNADESGFHLCPKSGKVLGLRGRDLNIVKPGNTKENLTALITFTADGRLCPPLVIFPYVKPPKAVVDSMPDEWVLGKTDSGWMKSNVFFEYVANSLHEWLKKEEIQRPILFLVDGHKSHMSLELSKFCDENEIILYALPPNATHLLQPADVAVFKPLKEYWRQEVREWQAKHENRVVTKTEFCPIFHKVLQHPKMSTNMKNGFKACGLYPFNPDAVNYKKCVQNVLEELSNKADEVRDEIITDADINSATKVIFRLEPVLSERGICTDSIVSLIQSLLPPKNHDNEVSCFTEQEIDNMELVFIDEKQVVKPKIIILNNSLLNVDLEKQIFETPELNKELIEDKIQIAENAVLNGGKTEQENFEKEMREAAELILDTEKLENNQSFDEIILDIEKNYQESKNTEKPMSEGKTESKNFDQRMQSNEKPSLDKQEIQRACEKSCEVLKERLTNNSFEKHLTYPQPLTKNVKKRKKEKTPSAISSNAWRTYYENKQKEKEEKENAKKRRKLGMNKIVNKNAKSNIPSNKETDNDKKSEEKYMKYNETEIENEEGNQIGFSGLKQKCSICQEELESDTECENEKNVGCDLCPRWYHLGCTKFTGLSYSEISNLDFTCDFCDD